MLRCSKDAAGQATESSGGKEKSNREVTYQPGSEVASPCGATRAHSVRASKLATNRRHRRSLLPSSAACFEGANQNRGRGLGAPPPEACFLRPAGFRRTSRACLLDQWQQRQPLLFVPSFRRVCEARLSRLLQSSPVCHSSQEFELLPTLNSTLVRRGTEVSRNTN